MASFTDKLKTTIKNTDSLAGQKLDEAKYAGKISDQKSKKNKFLNEAGEKIFEIYLTGVTEIDASVTEILDKAKACDEEIARLEAEKQDTVNKEREERESRKE